jgi:Cu(I)/Ag(I) efflux system membrane fusion protein/cobalt-zinc-cadmium efflux system membrane fusion protein
MIIKYIAAVFITAVLVTTLYYFTDPAFLNNSAKSSSQEEIHSEHEEEQLYTCSMHPFIVEDEPGTCPVCGMDLILKKQSSKNEYNQGKERKIAYWKAPMNPREIYNEPGKSAMGMDLVPVYEDQLVSGVNIKIDPVIIQNMGIKTETVKKAELNHKITAYGHITYDEKKITEINPRYSGWVEKLYVNSDGESVKKNDPLFKVYSPELITAQKEYISALKRSSYNKGSGKKYTEAAESRLLNYGLSQSFIKSLGSLKSPKSSVIIKADKNGIIRDKDIFEGGYFPKGKTLMKITDISRVWVEVHIFDNEIPLVKEGMEAEMKIPFMPEKTFKGKISHIYPYVTKKTREVIARIEFENENLELKPDTYVDIEVTASSKTGIAVSSQAIIRTGKENIVFIVKENNKFIPRKVVTGAPVNSGKIHILSGLAPGDKVVTSGQFMLDSESNLNEAISKMTGSEEEKYDKTGSDDDFFDDM